MGNSSSFLPSYSCLDANLSRNTVTPEFWDSFSISDDFRSSSIVLAVIVLLLFLVGLPSNVIIAASIIGKKLYREPTHILLLNLAISDSLVCLLVMPQVIVAGFAGGYVFGDSDYVRCQVCQSGLILVALTLISMYTIGFLSVDRFVFIKFPLHYSMYITPLRVTLVVATAWVLSLSVALIPLSGFAEYKYSYTTSACILNLIGRNKATYYVGTLLFLNLVPVIVVIVTNIWIACFVRKEIHKVYKVRKSLSSNEQLRLQKLNIQKAIRRKKNKKQLTLIRVFGAILIASVVVWLPLVIHIILLQTVDPNDIPLGVYVIVFVCLVLHSVLHPLIEGCIIPEIKSSFKNILGISVCKKCCRKDAGGVKKDTEPSESNSLNSGSCTCMDFCSYAVLQASSV